MIEEKERDKWLLQMKDLHVFTLFVFPSLFIFSNWCYFRKLKSAHTERWDREV